MDNFSWKDALLLVPAALGGTAWPIWEKLSPETCDAKAIALCFLSGVTISIALTLFKLIKSAKNQKGLKQDWARLKKKVRIYEDANLVMSTCFRMSRVYASKDAKLMQVADIHEEQMKKVQEGLRDEKN